MTTVTVTARVVKEHAERRSEILDAGQALFYEKGYEKTSVANILEVVGIAKGTFYHYFDSKEDLLDQIIERQSGRIDGIIAPIAEHSTLPAIEKFNQFFLTVGHYKASNKAVMMMLTKVLYAEENIKLLHKMSRHRKRVVAPKLAMIISQGVSEGVFGVDSALYAAEMILEMGNSLGDEFGRIVLEEELDDLHKQQYLERCEAYDRAAARILGAREGSLCIFDRAVLETFFEE